MNKLFYYSVIFPLIFISLISVLFIPAIVGYYSSQGVEVNFAFLGQSLKLSHDLNFSGDYIWPTPGYKTITSTFGYRTAPATGASSYHGAIDIGAPEGTRILAIADGTVSYAGWDGANGYTVKIDYGNGISSTYGHVNPNMLVKQGEQVVQGEIVAQVGPKYVDKKSYTNYTDSSGKCTNGATTGPHLHFAISRNGRRINPNDLY